MTAFLLSEPFFFQWPSAFVLLFSEKVLTLPATKKELVTCLKNRETPRPPGNYADEIPGVENPKTSHPFSGVSKNSGTIDFLGS